MGFAPFRWQRRLFDQYFVHGELPTALDLPTGLGKTTVMAIWYIAVEAGARLPRRLVYVVDRRAVVD
jgi:CRISPR-associated endonuclease/helicase Cas3